MLKTSNYGTTHMMINWEDLSPPIVSTHQQMCHKQDGYNILTNNNNQNSCSNFEANK